jgi:isoleucyl-tRNA synthetase
VEQTALAEAEVEYHDHRSTQVWVRFPIVSAAAQIGNVRSQTPGNLPALGLDDASVVIWTTTPWTLPANRAIAYGREILYAVYKVDEVAEGSLARPGEKLLLAEALVESAMQAAKVTAFTKLHGPVELGGVICRHPLHAHPKADSGYDFLVKLFPGDFVTADTGTGFVHVAPAHGEDDWQLWEHYKKLGETSGDVVETVLGDGTYAPSVPLFAGLSVLAEGKEGKYYSPAEKPILAALKEVGALLAQAPLIHSYPHSWRSKAPLIFRATPQWFISMEANGLRQKALAAIEATRFVPPQGKERLHAMIASRPDWCVSRQRAWGVPIAVFVDRRTGQPLRDQTVIDRIADIFAREGAEAWFESPPQRFLGNDYDAANYAPVTDIVEVWFDSGSTHAFVLEERSDLAWPASLYLEGSDQHRGWFHSSLLESCGTRGRAPFDAVLTHGFVMDELGRKMSKSLGNVTAPQEVVGKFGADILRLWVVWSDYAEDLRIGPEILKHVGDIYRRLRNTLRYLLGNLDGFDAAERVEPAAMPELERWILHRLWQLDRMGRRAIAEIDLHNWFTELHGFCATELSAFYFDIRKDSLYCDALMSPRRRAARTLLERLFDCLTAWLAPVLAFTAEEAWLARNPGPEGADPEASVHLRLMPELPDSWCDDALAAKWELVRRLRRVVTGALEVERAQRHIGASLQAHPVIYAGPDYVAALEGLDLAELAITSGATLIEGPLPEGAFTLPDLAGIGVLPGLAQGAKCERCWMVLTEVGRHRDHPGLCDRCHGVVSGLVAAA